MRQPMLATFEQPRLFEGLEVHWPYVKPPASRPIPKRAMYRNDHVDILGYEGDGRFLVVWGDLVTSIHRSHLTFMKARKQPA